MCNCEKAKGFKTPCYINCKECNRVINYRALNTYKNATKRSKNFGLCSSCLKKGDRNPFYNKNHSEESMIKMIESSNNSESRKQYYKKIKSKEYRDELSKKMRENPPMLGNSYLKIWIEKYGEEKAKEMNEVCSLKKATKGEKNYWFGKTPPFGSGNGWSGWYKGWYFRSLLELSYMINVIEKFNIKWETGESEKYRVRFEHKNRKKNYYPDFVLENKYIIECKPKKLWNTSLVEDKKKAAEIFCKENNFIYKLREVPKLTDKEILFHYNCGNIVWIQRYQKKFEERIEKNLL
jgi:hypothetical protein